MHILRSLNLTSDKHPYGSLKWSYVTQGVVASAPTVDINGTLYIGSWDNYLYVMFPDGSLKWRFLTGGGIYSKPAIDSYGTVYIGSFDYYIYAIYSDGSLKWRYKTENEIWSSAALDSDDNIFIQSYDLYLYAFSPNGSLKWKYLTMRHDHTLSPVVTTDNIVYIFDGYFCMFALTQDGIQIWTYCTLYTTVRMQTVLGLDDTLYINTDVNNELHAISTEGTLKWIYYSSARTVGAPAIAPDGTLYIGSSDNTIQKISFEGQLLWKYSMLSYSVSLSLCKDLTIGSDGIIYVPSWDYTITAVLPQGSVSWQYRANGAVITKPAIGLDGTVYIGSNDNSIYAIYSSSVPSHKTSVNPSNNTSVNPSNNTSVNPSNYRSAVNTYVAVGISLALVGFCCILFFGVIYCFRKRILRQQPSFQTVETPRPIVPQQAFAVSQPFDYTYVNTFSSTSKDSNGAYGMQNGVFVNGYAVNNTSYDMNSVPVVVATIVGSESDLSPTPTAPPYAISDEH